MKTKSLPLCSLRHCGASLLFILFTFLQINVMAQAEANHGPGDCYEHWKFKLYEDPYYHGGYLCFGKGEYNVQQDSNDYPYRKFSFKIRHGYVVCFYDHLGRLIRKADRSQRHVLFSFYKFVVKRAGAPDHPQAPGYVDCYPDWKFKLFEQPNHQGDFDCFRKGEYYAGNDCDDYTGRYISFKLRPGYMVCFYDRYDHLLRKFTSGSSYYSGGFYKFIVKKRGHHDDQDDQVGCYDDWRVKIFSRPHFRGDYQCFRKGDYRNGEDCDDYDNRAISFKIRHGWELWIYNQYGHRIRKYRNDVPYYRGDLYRFEVRRTNNGHGPYGGN